MKQINMRHDFALILVDITKEQADTIYSDLKTYFGWRVTLEEQDGETDEDPKKYILFLAMDNEEKIVKEAEKQECNRVILYEKEKQKVKEHC